MLFCGFFASLGPDRDRKGTFVILAAKIARAHIARGLSTGGSDRNCRRESLGVPSSWRESRGVFRPLQEPHRRIKLPAGILRRIQHPGGISRRIIVAGISRCIKLLGGIPRCTQPLAGVPERIKLAAGFPACAQLPARRVYCPAGNLQRVKLPAGVHHGRAETRNPAVCQTHGRNPSV